MNTMCRFAAPPSSPPRAALTLALLLLPLAAAAEEPRPLTPQDDERVLTRVPVLPPEARARALALRSGQPAPAADLPLALRQAQQNITLARQHSDPRFIGYAQAALAPWWELAAPPPEVLVMRAIIRQHQHDFSAALADLEQALSARPTLAQAWMTRASLQLVRGDVAGARTSCERLVALTSPLASAGCMGTVEGVSGSAAAALTRLEEVLDRSTDKDPARPWVLTLMAELAARMGDAVRAEALFKRALSAGEPDAYLLAAWADFLLERGRAEEVFPVLSSRKDSDGLLLRLALAERAARRSPLSGHAEELARRFAASRARGDVIHLREEAIFTLHLAEDPARALKLAQENWALQREPTDARILLEAALAARAPAEAEPVLRWMEETGIEDVRLHALAAQLQGGAR